MIPRDSQWENRVAAQRQAKDRIAGDFFFALDTVFGRRDPIFSSQDVCNIAAENGPAKILELERRANSAARTTISDAIPVESVDRVSEEGREIRPGKGHLRRSN